MKSFSDREKGFEAEFNRNQELRFRVTARGNRLFGLWAAARMDIPDGQAAEDPIHNQGVPLTVRPEITSVRPCFRIELFAGDLRLLRARARRATPPR